MSRRSFLSYGAVGLGVATIGATCGAVGTDLLASNPPSVEMPPDVDLMEEHGVLKRLLLVYREAIRRMDSGLEPPVSAIHDSATIIHDFIEGFHEALEEGYVFPTLKAAGKLVATVDTLLVQHARGRECTQLILSVSNRSQMSATIQDQIKDAMSAFMRMYEPHEAREDTVVFPAFRSVLTTNQLQDIAMTFDELQRKQFGVHGFADTVDHVAVIEQSIGIYDLGQFTPAPLSSLQP